jgi:choice-of-anchor B domain-containing protein
VFAFTQVLGTNKGYIMKKWLLLSFISFFVLEAQNFNVTFKDTALIQDGNRHNDIWGFSRNNEEYVILGKRLGFVLYKVLNTGEAELIVQENSANNENSTWGEYRYYNDHIYQSTEAGPIRVYEIDFNAKTSTYKSSFGRARYHNIALYNNFIIGCGGSNSSPYMDSFDLNTSLTNPTKKWEYTKNYVHDFVVQDGKIYMAELYQSNFAIYDISNVTTSTLGEDKLILRHHYQNGFTHNLWPTPDGKYLVTTDEHNQFDHVQWWDISDVNNVRNIAKIQEGGPSIVHNAFIKNDFIYMSYYDRGLIIYDIADKNLPVKIGEYDTYAQGQNHSNGQFQGAWGTYPYLDSNIVAVSDVTNGLFLLEFDQNIRAGKIEYTLVDSVSGNPLEDASQITFLSTDKAVYERVGSKLIMKSVKDKSISFRISMENFGSKEFSFSLANNQFLTDTIKLRFIQLPTKPENLSLVSVTDTSIRIQWEESSFATDYELFRSESEGSGFVNVATISKDSTSYTDTGLVNNKSYYYKLFAKNLNGNSESSNILLARTGLTAPVVPDGLTASSLSINSIEITWNNVENETGYFLHRSKANATSFELLNSLSTDSVRYTDTNLDANTIYYYKVLAFNSVGSSDFSTNDSAKTWIPIPTEPLIDSIFAKSPNEIRLKWRLKEYAETYKIYRSNNMDSNFSLVQTATTNQVEFIDTNLNPFSWYYYKIVASNSRGDSDYSGVKGIRTISPDFEKPVASIHILKSSEISLASFLTIYLSYSEELTETPIVKINGAIENLIEFNNDQEIYQIKKYFNTDGDYTMQISAEDLYENSNIETVNINVQTISTSNSQSFYIAENTQLVFDEKSFSSKTKFYTILNENDEFNAANRNFVSKVFQFTQLHLAKKQIKFQYKLNVGNDSFKYSLYGYQELEDKWIRIPSTVVNKNILESSLSSEFTKYAVLYDESYQFIPQTTEIYPNYPNPFNPSTTIKFDLAKNQLIQLNIYNILGQKVRSLYSGLKAAGQHEFLWNGNNDIGQTVSSGIYFYRLITANKILTHRMIFIK